MSPLTRRELLAASLVGTTVPTFVSPSGAGETKAAPEANSLATDACAWLEYSVDPGRVRNLPASYGNNRVMFRCDIRRLEVSGLCSSVIRASVKPPVDRDIISAVYDAETGEKYPLSLEYAQEARVSLRPDQHIWASQVQRLRVGSPQLCTARPVCLLHHRQDQGFKKTQAASFQGDPGLRRQEAARPRGREGLDRQGAGAM